METETQQTVATITKFEATQQKTNRLLAQNKITVQDIEGLHQLERDYVAETCTQKLAGLKGTERDNFLDKIEQIMAPHTKTDIWELNHTAITGAIAGYMEQYGAMPIQRDIAEKTGLSRQTIAKHMAAYKNQPQYAAQMEQFQFLMPKVLANVFKRALKGDMKAARLYFEFAGTANRQATNTQNNYMQINNTILNQDNLKQLSAEQLDLIEKVINLKRQ